jgi:hypothetical protein
MDLTIIISSISALATIIMGFYLKKVSETQSTLIENQSKVVATSERLFNMIPIETLEKIIPHAVSIKEAEVKREYEAKIESMKEQWQQSNSKAIDKVNVNVEEALDKTIDIMGKYAGIKYFLQSQLSHNIPLLIQLEDWLLPRTKDKKLLQDIEGIKNDLNFEELLKKNEDHIKWFRKNQTF